MGFRQCKGEQDRRMVRNVRLVSMDTGEIRVRPGDDQVKGVTCPVSGVLNMLGEAEGVEDALEAPTVWVPGDINMEVEVTSDNQVAGVSESELEQGQEFLEELGGCRFIFAGGGRAINDDEPRFSFVEFDVEDEVLKRGEGFGG